MASEADTAPEEEQEEEECPKCPPVGAHGWLLCRYGHASYGLLCPNSALPNLTSLSSADFRLAEKCLWCSACHSYC